MNTFLFAFSFTFDNDENEDGDCYEHEYVIRLTGDIELLKKYNEHCETEEYCEFVSDSERFGVHDVGYSCPYIEGFNSYEVEKKNVSKVMNNFEKMFQDFGFETEQHFVGRSVEGKLKEYAEETLTEEDISIAKEICWN